MVPTLIFINESKGSSFDLKVIDNGQGSARGLLAFLELE